MSTPIEIVRESLTKLQDPFVMFHARPEKKAFTEALASVLRDAERFKALERAVWIRVEVTRGDRSFTGRRQGASNEFSCESLAELADTLKRVSQ